MQMGLNDILLHYEEFGGFDYKVTVTVFLITKYIQAVTGLSEAYAKKKALDMRDPIVGWALVMDDDERFYEWCKRRFYQRVVASRNKGKQKYIVYWLTKPNKELKFKQEGTFGKAIAEYERQAEHGLQTAIYVQKNNADIYSNPIRQKNNPVELLEMVAEMSGKTAAMTERAKCMRNRMVKNCSECCRFMDCERKWLTE